MMTITLKSLDRSNVAFVFKQDGFVVPENGAFTNLYGGDISKGANFVDDPVMRIKVLHLPILKMTFTLEGFRFRVDHDPDGGNLESSVVSEALKACKSLFPRLFLESYGFNFDLTYRFENVIQLNYIFGLLANSDKILEKKDLTAMGFQFTLQKPGGISEAYFLKIVSPLELSTHVNYHFDSDHLPDEQKMKGLFEKSYEKIDQVIKNLRF